MNFRLGGGLVLLVAASAITAGIWSYNRDEMKLKRAILRVAEQAEKSAPESPIFAAGRADGIAGSFVETPEFEITGVEIPSTIARGELRAQIYYFRENLDRLEIRIDDVSAAIAPDHLSATQTFTARVTASGRAAEESGVREVRIFWAKTDEGWKIRRIEASEGFRRI